MQKISMHDKKGIEQHSQKQKSGDSGIENQQKKYDRDKEKGQFIGKDFTNPDKVMVNTVMFVQGRWKMNRKRFRKKIARNQSIPEMNLVKQDSSKNKAKSLTKEKMLIIEEEKQKSFEDEQSQIKKL